MVLLAQVHPWVTGILIAVFLFICLLMILVVLIQRPAGGGLSGAFGSGAGSGQTAFGAKTGDALTIATVTVFFIYLLFAVGLNYAARPTSLPPPEAAQVTAPVPPGGAGEQAPPAESTPATPAPMMPPEGEPAATPGAPAEPPANEP